MLREAGTQRGLSFELVSVPWAERGWGAARTELRHPKEESCFDGSIPRLKRGEP